MVVTVCVGSGQDITMYHSTVDTARELPHSHHCNSDIDYYRHLSVAESLLFSQK